MDLLEIAAEVAAGSTSDDFFDGPDLVSLKLKKQQAENGEPGSERPGEEVLPEG
jgi:hypothetical protein